MLRTHLIVLIIINQLSASDRPNPFVLLPLEVQNHIAAYLWNQKRESDAEFIERTTRYGRVSHEHLNLAFQHQSVKTNINAPSHISTYSTDLTQIITLERDFINGIYTAKISQINIALDTMLINETLTALVHTPDSCNTRLIALSHDKAQFARLDISYYDNDEYCKNMLTVIDVKTGTKKELPITSKKIASIHFNKQGTKLIAYEDSTPPKYTLILLTSPDKDAQKTDMSLAAHFAQHCVCKTVGSSIIPNKSS